MLTAQLCQSDSQICLALYLWYELATTDLDIKLTDFKVKGMKLQCTAYLGYA